MKIGDLAKATNTLPETVRFYEREGYRRIPCFGYYADAPQSLCYERAL